MNISHTKFIRKSFSVVDRCKIIMKQDLKCIGYYCKEEVELPDNFQIDHIFSLHDCILLLKNEIPFDSNDEMHQKLKECKNIQNEEKRMKSIYTILNNLDNCQALCGKCHDKKTAQEKARHRKRTLQQMKILIPRELTDKHLQKRNKHIKKYRSAEEFLNSFAFRPSVKN